MVKKPTITCKVCGGEHQGLLCTKFQRATLMPKEARKTAIAGLLAAPPPAPKKAKKTKAKKKKKRAKKASPAAPAPQPPATEDPK